MQKAAPKLEDEASSLREKYESRSEKWAESEKGFEAFEKLDVLDNLIDEIQCAVDSIESIVNE